MAESNFQKLAQKLAQEKGVKDPRGLAASIGRKKFGRRRMQVAAQKGVSAASVKKY